MLEQMMKMLEGQRINSYRLNKFLGAGGFGGVFHASEMVRNTLVQEVAVKVIPESSCFFLGLLLKSILRLLRLVPVCRFSP